MSSAESTSRTNALHRLHLALRQHPHGLTAMEVAKECRLKPHEAFELLEVEERVGRVATVLAENRDDVLYLLTGTAEATSPQLRPTPPPNLQQQPSRLRPRLVLSIGAGGVLLVLTGFLANVTTIWSFASPGNSTDSPRASEAAPEIDPKLGAAPVPVPQGHVEERVSAEVMSATRRRWSEEAADLERRLEHQAALARDAGCKERWQAEDRCYMEGRLRTESEFQEEDARVRLRLAELRRLIESSRR